MSLELVTRIKKDFGPFFFVTIVWSTFDIYYARLYYKENAMKVKKLILKLNRAEVEHNIDKARKFWFKLLKKSLKHKHTEAVK